MKNKEIKNFIKFEQELNERKKIPEKEKKKIKSRTITNAISIILVSIYLSIIAIMERNIETTTYMIILKIFSVVLSIVSIIMIEISYKKNDNALILITVEVLVLTFFTIFLISAYSLYYGQFYKVIVFGISIAIIYYLVKNILYIKKIKKEYYKSLNDIKTIVAK